MLPGIMEEFGITADVDGEVVDVDRTKHLVLVHWKSCDKPAWCSAPHLKVIFILKEAPSYLPTPNIQNMGFLV